MRQKWIAVGFFGLAFLAISCNRVVLNQEKSWDLDPGEMKEVSIDPAKREQKVKVEMSSSAAPVDIFVFLEKDRKAAEAEIRKKNNPPQGVLAHMNKTQSAVLEPTIPADQVFVVQVQGAGKPTKVKLQITN